MIKVARLYGQKSISVDLEAYTEPASNEVCVDVKAGGICGSDLHYYHDGGFGPVRVIDPIILGHEMSGVISAIGSDVTGFNVGDLVAINPSHPCEDCIYCAQAQPQHCLKMKFLGSAMLRPHIDGGFREKINVRPEQLAKFAKAKNFCELALTEPLSVCLHGLGYAGNIEGKKVLVTGAGPIGAIIVALAKYNGAGEIVVTDINKAPLETALKLGANKVLNTITDEKDIRKLTHDKGYFDVVFECSAAPSAMQNAAEMIKPRGIWVQLGVTGSVSFPINLIVGKEIQIKGSQRFHSEFWEAAKLIDTNAIDLTPILSHQFPVDDIEQALEFSNNRKLASKVSVLF